LAPFGPSQRSVAPRTATSRYAKARPATLRQARPRHATPPPHHPRTTFATGNKGGGETRWSPDWHPRVGLAGVCLFKRRQRALHCSRPATRRYAIAAAAAAAAATAENTDKRSHTEHPTAIEVVPTVRTLPSTGTNNLCNTGCEQPVPHGVRTACATRGTNSLCHTGYEQPVPKVRTPSALRGKHVA
jgi:hypothetical protein